MPESLKVQLVRHEGLRLKPYLDCCGKPWRECVCEIKGNLTFGVGRNLDDVGISRAEALLMLDNDIQTATDELNTELPWSANLEWPRRAVLINMTFNMGITRLLGFRKMLFAVQEGLWQAAHDEMLASMWARQTGRRAIELARIMLTGEIPE